MKATCTWGDGPDVLVVLEGSHLMLYHDPVDKERAKHGYCSEGSVELTADEAESLAKQLLAATACARKFDEDWLKVGHKG